MFSNKKSYSVEKFHLERTPNREVCDTSSGNDLSITNDISNQQTNHQTTFKPILGFFYVFLHATFYQFTSVIIKLLPYINPCQLSLIRNFSIFAAVLPVTIYHEDPTIGKREDRLFLLLRSFFGATSLYFSIIAYSYLPLAEASIILSTCPIVTAVMARILLKEPYGLVQSGSLLMTVCGVLLALRTPELLRNRSSVLFDSTYIAGLAASVGYVLLHALSAVYTRKLENVHFSIMLMYFGFVGAVENAVLNTIFIPFVLPKCGLDQLLCILLAVFGIISNAFFTTAFQVQPAGLSAVQKSSFDILIIIVFQIIFFNLYPDIYVICGACFVIVSLIVIGIRNWILIMPNSSKIRKTFKFLLK